ncbi:replication-relaxation family protein [Peribacillus loiseleuriae]|uniref:replication-relaxation family protein n=1 Tax=Peribacillus loiseleuriae TaxID=1679170 RepID=UPI003CFC475B
MAIILNKRISDKDLLVLQFLFRMRGATAAQLVKGLNYPNTISSEKNMYKPLKKLGEIGLVDYQFIKLHTRNFYFLSEEGYNFMIRFMNLQPQHRGKGFYKDYGVFDFKLQRPPSQQHKHFLMQVDTFLEFEKIRDVKMPGIYFDYRDNRYCSKKFELISDSKEKKVWEELKPDGEVLIVREVVKKESGKAEVRKTKNIYSIEVDTGTERKVRLLNKFQQYKLYFDYLKKKKQPLPRGIIFVSNTKEREFGLEARWFTISNAFHEAVGEYSFQVNLIHETMDQINLGLHREILGSKIAAQAFKNIIPVLENSPDFKGLPLKYFSEELPYNGGMATTLVEIQEGKGVLFCYVRVDGFETLGWNELKHFLEFLSNEKTLNTHYSRIQKVVPVCLFLNKPSNMPDSNFFKGLPLLSLQDTILYNVSNNKWFTKDLDVIDKIPLIPISERLIGH